MKSKKNYMEICYICQDIVGRSGYKVRLMRRWRKADQTYKASSRDAYMCNNCYRTYAGEKIVNVEPLGGYDTGGDLHEEFLKYMD